MKKLYILHYLASTLLFCTRVQGQCLYNEECIVVKNCSSVLKQITQTPLQHQDIQRIKNFQCGYDHSSKQPKVCCPRAAPPDNSLLPDEKDCGKELNPSAIYRGQTTTINEFPWIVLLQYQTPNGTQLLYSGVLISHNYVLTAAHCIVLIPEGWKLTSVRLGEHQLDTDPDCEGTDEFVECADPVIDVPVENVIVHSEFFFSVSNQENDIALLRLNRSVSYSESIQPICLPKSSEFTTTNFTGSNMIVAGFSTVGMSGQSNIKQKTVVSITANSACAALNKHFGSSKTDTKFCTRGMHKRQLCISDSGSPLMKARTSEKGNRWYLYGIMSVGQIQCDSDVLEIYTNVFKYMSWIIENLRP